MRLMRPTGLTYVAQKKRWPDDDPQRRQRYDDVNLKANEYLHRRLDLADAVDAHLIAAEQLSAIGFGRYLVSATTPFEPEHLSRLRSDAPGVVRSLFPDCQEEYSRRCWTMPPSIDRVYVNTRAREELGWKPRFNFRHVLDRLHRGEDVFSSLAREVGIKGYHSQLFEEGPYPVESSAYPNRVLSNTSLQSDRATAWRYDLW